METETMAYEKAEVTFNGIRYLAGKISKESVEGVAWFLLTAYSKIQDERNKLKAKLLSKKGTRTVHIIRN